MMPYSGSPSRREEEYADQPRTRDDEEPVYPDGTPKHECWNSSVLRRPAPKAVKKPRPSEEEDEP